MPISVVQNFTLTANNLAILQTGNVTRSFVHKASETVTLDPGGTTTHTVHLDAFAAGSMRLHFRSIPSGTLAAPVYQAFTVAIDGGTPIPIDDLMVLNLSAKPTTIILGLPVGAAAPVDVTYELYGQ